MRRCSAAIRLYEARSASSFSFRLLMSVWVPMVRSGRPSASRLTTLPRVSIYFQLPSRQRIRISREYTGVRPAM